MQRVMQCTECGAFMERGSASALGNTWAVLCANCFVLAKQKYEPICDFCCGRPVEWAYPSQRMLTPDQPALDSGMVLTSEEGWAACEPCHALIESDQWEALSKRSTLSYLRMQGRFEFDEKLYQAHRLLHAKFREFRTGKPYRQTTFIEKVIHAKD